MPDPSKASQNASQNLRSSKQIKNSESQDLVAEQYKQQIRQRRDSSPRVIDLRLLNEGSNQTSSAQKKKRTQSAIPANSSKHFKKKSPRKEINRPSS